MTKPWPNPRPLQERFWEKVKKTDGCWEWTGYRTRKGYGEVYIRGEGSRRAHRVSYQLHHGTVPKSMQILHRCDNPPCVNPDHLFLGTAADNTRDMLEKGRFKSAKLSDREVLEIRRKYASGETQDAIAKEFHIDQTNVSQIVLGKTWKNLQLIRPS